MGVLKISNTVLRLYLNDTKSKQITFVQPSILCTDILYLCYFHEAVNLETTLGNGAGDWNLTITALQGACDLKHLQNSTNKQMVLRNFYF